MFFSGERKRMTFRQSAAVPLVLNLMLACGIMMPSGGHLCSAFHMPHQSGLSAVDGEDCSSAPGRAARGESASGAHHGHDASDDPPAGKICVMKTCPQSHPPLLSLSTAFFGILSESVPIVVHSDDYVLSPHLDALFRPPRRAARSG
jgi:hypothetical protein